jgi:hypothetical protein
VLEEAILSLDMPTIDQLLGHRVYCDSFLSLWSLLQVSRADRLQDSVINYCVIVYSDVLGSQMSFLRTLLCFKLLITVSHQCRSPRCRFRIINFDLPGSNQKKVR